MPACALESYETIALALTIGKRAALAFRSLEVLQFVILGKWGIMMLRYRLALLAAGIVLLAAPSAWAFSLQNGGAGGEGNSSFTDPDEQITNNFAPGVRRLDSSEQSMQIGVPQQGTFDPIWWEQSLHGYGPYSQTARPGK